MSEKHFYVDMGCSAEEFRQRAEKLLAGKWAGATDIEWLLDGPHGSHMVRFFLPKLETQKCAGAPS